MGKKKYTDEILKKAVKESFCFSDVVRKLGASPTSVGVYNHITRRIKELGLDTSHFEGRNANIKNRHSGLIKKKSAKEILVTTTSGIRTKTYLLRRAMIESGVPYKCSICLINKWQNKSLTLEVEHIDGNSTNNLLKNLCFLCPNCHSQTPTYSKRKI